METFWKCVFVKFVWNEFVLTKDFWFILIHFDPIQSNLIKKFKNCKVSNETIKNLILME